MGIYWLTKWKSLGGGLASGLAGSQCSNAALRRLTLTIFQHSPVLASFSGRLLPALERRWPQPLHLTAPANTLAELFPNSSHKNPRADSHWATLGHVILDPIAVARGRDLGHVARLGTESG